MKIFPILATALATLYAVDAAYTGGGAYGAGAGTNGAGTGATNYGAGNSGATKQKSGKSKSAAGASSPTTSTTAGTVGTTATGGTTNIDVSSYPALDVIPDVNSTQVQAWLAELDLSGVPNLPISNGGVATSNTAVCTPPTVIEPDQGSWTCQKFVASDDIQQCPDTGTWGVTYDDGPSLSTPLLLNELSQNNVKATFFVVGSRVISNPAILQSAYNAGHHIAVHTWSHPSLTSLTNEQIVAELMWTIKAIKQVIGVTPVYMRPPYGDTDNRVRAIARLLGLKTVLWIPTFDSNDWTLFGTNRSVDIVINTFETWMQEFPTMDTGFIVLEHDLFPQTVAAALQIIPRAAKVSGLKMMTVPQCVGDNKPYLELGGGTNTTSKSNNTISGENSYVQGNNNTAQASSSAITISLTAGPIIAVILSSLLNLI